MTAECGTCANGKRRGAKMMFCVLLGIDISRSHTGCGYHRSAIIMEDEGAGIIEDGAFPEVQEQREQKAG